MRRAIIWFRNDLRLHDNESLVDALAHAEEVIPIYVIDERSFGGTTSFGFPKTGAFRAKFILESIVNLRKNLQSIGSDLYVAFGKPEEIIAQCARTWKTSWVYCNRERTAEEVFVQDQLESNLWVIGQEIRYNRGKMLYYTADLPFPVTHCPDSFTSFRKETEQLVKVRTPFETPIKGAFKPISFDVDWGSIPSMQDLGYDDFKVAQGLEFTGGEDEALKQLDYYLWQSKLIAQYKETRNGLLGRDYSSKFSAWLSTGCLSPKKVYHEVKKFEAEHGGNESSYHLIFELLWRDFFRLMGKKHGNAIFRQTGIQNSNLSGTEDRGLFDLWAKGETGIPFIDANMKELNETGFMSNRGRQNVASFLVKDLKLNWVMGAEYFESLLIDYDPCSNYGNWNYISGVGNDPRTDRYFNIVSQAKRYDAKAEFVKYWLPQLNQIPADKIHHLDALTKEEQSQYNCIIGEQYPQACIETKHWV